MIFDSLMNFLAGRVTVDVKGRIPEKYLNICLRRGMKLSGIQKKGGNVLSFGMRIKDFKASRVAAKKSRVRVHIVKKTGLPFVLHRYRKRKVFAAGALLFVAILIFMSSFIWKIDVVGVTNTDRRLITAILDANNIKVGHFKAGLDTDRTVTQLLTTINTVAWAELTIKGTVATLTVSERDMPPPIVDMKTPCNIVASKDGLIVKIDTKNGLAMVKAGDTVIRSQLLVTGQVPINNPTGGTRLEHSIADILARTWYTASVPVETRISSRNRTGKAVNRYILAVGDKKINLNNPSILYENYDKIENEKGLSKAGLIIETYYEVTVTETEFTLDQAKDLAAAEAFKQIRQQVPPAARIVKSTLVFTEREEGSHNAEITVECFENIGKTVPIGGN